MRDLARFADELLARGLDPHTQHELWALLALGYSPLVLLRSVAERGPVPRLVWLAAEASMHLWCREELARIREGTAEGSAEWRRVRRWLWLLDEADGVEITLDFDVKHPADFDHKGG